MRQEGGPRGRSAFTLPFRVRNNLDALLYEPAETQLCRLQRTIHGARDDCGILGYNVGEASAEALAEGCTLLDTLFGEGRVWDLVVLCEVMAGLRMANEYYGWGHGCYWCGLGEW